MYLSDDNVTVMTVLQYFKEYIEDELILEFVTWINKVKNWRIQISSLYGIIWPLKQLRVSENFKVYLLWSMSTC